MVLAERSLESPARVIVAAIPGENHGHAVQMLEIVGRDAGALVWNLGSNCPVESLILAAEATRSSHILLHISAANAGIKADQSVKELVEGLGSNEQKRSVELIVGGAGALRNRRGAQGATYLNDLVELRRRIMAWKTAAPTSATE